jgi:hypothetical protein
MVQEFNIGNADGLKIHNFKIHKMHISYPLLQSEKNNQNIIGYG